MFNKFKISELVLCCGISEVTQKYICKIGKVVEKDYYYQDYCIKFEDGTEEWMKEKDIQKILRKKKNMKKKDITT